MFVVNPLHKRCLALAKALLKEGPPSREDLELVKGPEPWLTTTKHLLEGSSAFSGL